MGIIPLLLIILIILYSFYKYLMSKFVHFMNTFILVPPQRLINSVINAINKIIKGLNAPFNALHGLDIGFKIFGKRLSIKPFTKIIPKNLIPSCPNLPYKCIEEPYEYKRIFGYTTPKECPKKKEPFVKKKIDKDDGSGLLGKFILLLIILLLFLLYLGNQEGVNDTIHKQLSSVIHSKDAGSDNLAGLGNILSMASSLPDSVSSLKGLEPGASALPGALPGAGALPSALPGAGALPSALPGAGALPGALPGAGAIPGALPGVTGELPSVPGVETVTSSVISDLSKKTNT